MKIAVLCIATNFKIRMKIGNKALLKQEEKIYMSKILKEIELWVANSKEELVPIIITCFDEIYEMAVQKHLLAFKNEFGFISEAHVIRFGINSYPQADAYFILSTSETRIFQAEIFETLCEYRRNNPNKIVIARINDKLTLPMVFSSQFIEPVHSIVDRENGKFVLRSNSKNAVYLDITEEMIRNSDFHKGILPGDIGGSGYHKRNLGGVKADGQSDHVPEGDKSPVPGINPIRNVVIIRGGGRIATSIALTLHRFGYCVLITETQVPSTIYRSMSFAQAVFSSEIEIAGVTAYLVSPSQIQIQKAWSAGSIPVIIDPGAEVLQLFDQTTVIKSLFNENLIGRPSLDILTYLKNETNQTVSGRQKAGNGNADGADPDSQTFFSQYPLFALIDATSSKSPRPTCRSMAPVTIGLREDQQPKEDVLFKIETRMNSLYGKIIFRRELHVAHVDLESAETCDVGTKSSEISESGTGIPERPENSSGPSEKTETPGVCDRNIAEQGTKTGSLVLIHSLWEGRYKATRRIGDAIEQGTLVGQIIGNDESVTEVISPIAGRLVGNAASNTVINKNNVIAAVDMSIENKEDCLQPLPVDKTVAYAVLSLLEGKI